MVWAGNFSTGVNLLFYLTQKAAEVLDAESDFDPEVIEMHHRHKKDAPSGTAERLLEILKESRSLGDADVAHGRQGITGERPAAQIGSHSLRGGDVVGDHLVMFAGSGERLELTHRATDRVIFASGALRAAKWAVTQPAGLYSMQDVLGLTA
jgi:4-hydroxy-tetrahydrodipicolinate reductase